MRIAAADTTWRATGLPSDTTDYVKPQTIDGRDCLVLRPTSSDAYEVATDPWPVLPGHAYCATVAVSPSMDGAHAQCFIAWLNPDGTEIASRAHGPITFMEHAFAEEKTWGLAPDGATGAQLVIRFTSDEQTWKKATGTLRVASPRLEPSVVVTLAAVADDGLYAPGEPALHRLSLAGAPRGLSSIAVRSAILDYDQTIVDEADAQVPLTNGAGEIPLSLPAQSTGYHRVVVTTACEEIAPATAWASYAVIPPLDFPVPEDLPIALDAGISWWPRREYKGAQRSLSERARIKCEASARVGLRCLRDRLSWRETSPEPGVLEWDHYAVSHQAQSDAGISVYQMISHTPEWALVDTPAVAHRHSYPPANVRHYYDYVRYLIRDWGHAVRYFEPWNEPEAFFFQGYVWDLAALIKAAWLACRDADPSVGVLCASRSRDTEFWRRTFANGCARYFDIFNQHWYGPPESVFELLRQDRELMAGFGVERPVWMTEQGRRTDPDPDGKYIHAERAEVSYLLRSYACCLAAGCDRVFYFYLQEYLEWGQWLWGLMRDDHTPKPALMALATLIRQLRMAEPLGYVRQDDAYAVLFDRGDGEHVAVAWALDGGSVGLTLGEGACAVDSMGRRIRELPRGEVRPVLSEQPVFVRVVDTAGMAYRPVAPRPRFAPDRSPPSPDMRVWLQAIARPGVPYPDCDGMDREKTALAIVSGDTETVAWRVHNFSDHPATVRVEMDLPDGWKPRSANLAPVTVAPGTHADLPAEFTVGRMDDWMDSSVGARLLVDDRPTDVARVYYRSA